MDLALFSKSCISLLDNIFSLYIVIFFMISLLSNSSIIDNAQKFLLLYSTIKQLSIDLGSLIVSFIFSIILLPELF